VKLPGASDVEAFVSELSDFVLFARENPRFINKSVWFRLVRERRGSTGLLACYAIADRDRFPVVAEYCSNCLITGASPHINPVIRTSCDTRQIGIDKGELSRVVTKKLNKLSKLYRQRAAGKPVWLIIHSDGWPPSTRIPKQHAEQACTLIRELVTKADARFDAVWWAESTGFAAAAEIFRVWEATEPRNS
jgi:hypothetical protein